MTDTRPDRGVAPPRRGLRWQPPESKWAGRALFFAGGLAALGVWYRVFYAVESWGAAHLATLALTLVVPVGLAAAVIVQRVRRGASWRWLSFVAGLAVLPFVWTAITVVFPWVERKVRARPFDAAEWRAQTTLISSERKWMVDDLLERHPFVGRTRAEVEEVLGPPETAWTERSGNLACAYLIGEYYECLGRAWGPRVFVLEYGPDDRVVAVRPFER